MTHIINLFHKKKLLLLPVCFLLIAGIAIAFIYFGQIQKAAKIRQEYFDSLSADSYESAFFSMYPVNNYSPEIFSTYRGLSITIAPYTFSDLTELSAMLDAALLSGNPLSTVYLGLDPYQIWTASGENMDTWNSALEQNLLAYINAYPEITFEVLLPYPSLDYWTKQKDSKTNTILTTYRTLVCSLEPYANAITYFTGDKRWLIANPDNYESAFQINESIAKHITLYLFCDHNLQITADDVDLVFDEFKTMLQEEKLSPSVYHDLSKWQVVFFGDSLIGNYTGSASIPGVMAGLSNASVYNFAIGGTTATHADGNNATFVPITSSFRSGELTVTQDETTFDHSADSDNRLCFVIGYGTNDYFTGQPIDNPDNPYDPYTFSGALRAGIQNLQSAYPDATILLLTPPFCSYFTNGTEQNSDVGGILTEYVDAVVQVATDMNVSCLNNYTGLAINADNHTDYLADGVHLNETGRFLAATHIIEFLGNR